VEVVLIPDDIIISFYDGGDTSKNNLHDDVLCLDERNQFAA
jgi:hypothetical protein